MWISRRQLEMAYCRNHATFWWEMWPCIFLSCWVLLPRILLQTAVMEFRKCFLLDVMGESSFGGRGQWQRLSPKIILYYRWILRIWLVLADHDVLSQWFLPSLAWEQSNSGATLAYQKLRTSSGQSEGQLLGTTGTAVSGFCTKPAIMPYFSE